KFLLTRGEYLLGHDRVAGRVAFWGEWEPPSRVTDLYPTRNGLPRFAHEPFVEDRPTYRGLHNTDPFVFGPQFLYTNCQQYTNHGQTPTQLRWLDRGSVILFGSCMDR